MKDAIRNELLAMQDLEYRSFTSKLIPQHGNMIGIRMGNIRKLAQKIAKTDYLPYLSESSDLYMEELILQGLLIGSITDIETAVANIERFVPKIDNWSVCDSFCSSLKIARSYPNEIWDTVLPYFQSNREFELRFGVVMLIAHYIDQTHLPIAFSLFDQIDHDGYYVKMAVAWAVSMYFVAFPDETWTYLRNNHLDRFTFNKALQKIIESRIPSMQVKDAIRQLKRK